MKVLGKTLAIGVLGSLFAFPVMAQESALPQEPAPNTAPTGRSKRQYDD